ncbi:hypothetical protein [Pedosphaera parvula]|uniref:Uncharacterized protein n=1 Tax=Pedosphaera parvula (strain Ellin514) TaxID=320771 RepID=B9XIJ8_PEDPL|nr:hypothetical protein [Pedosphaera parvula]EEF60261.1 hypothetical protein Cflav_PD2957 [Pedosphaera parvula Ellin514]
MSLSGNGVRLATLTTQLRVKWDDTKESWRDAKSIEFEKKYLDELQQSVERAVMIIEKLDKLVTKVRRDCE